MPNRILIVDDNPTVCELIQEVLSSAEMESCTLTDSGQAAVRVTQERFDAVFLDVRMPAPDGIELTRQIRATGLNRRTPIVIITGEEDNTVLKRAFEAGASFFLFKPIDRHRILRLIRVTEGSIRQEARRYQRVKATCLVSIEYGQDLLNGTTLDLSLSGILVRAPSLLPVGSAVHVSLALKSGTPPLRVTARVVRVSEDNCMGLQIENAGPEETKRLQEFILPLILAEIK